MDLSLVRELKAAYDVEKDVALGRVEGPSPNNPMYIVIMNRYRDACEAYRRSQKLRLPPNPNLEDIERVLAYRKVEA